MRTTDDKKDNSMRVRFNKEMIEWIVRESKNRGITASQLIRDIIKEKMR